MPSANDFRAVRVQFVLFTPGLQYRSAKILTQILTRYEKQFDGEPITFPPFPVQKGPAPKGVLSVKVEPHLVLQSQDGRLKLEATPSRLDVTVEGEGISEESAAEHLGWASELGLWYLGFNEAKAGRVACVIHRLCDMAKPAVALSRHFCKERWTNGDGPLNRPSDFELHAHKRFQLGELFEINSWVRIKTAFVRDGGDPTPNMILVEQDFNSLAEQMEDREMSHAEIRGFFEHAPREMRHVFGMYFPQDPA